MLDALVTLIGIAAWCGSPSTVYSKAQVDQCRQEIWQCLKEHPRDAKCFTEEKLDK